jgi:hypothetical protein
MVRLTHQNGDLTHTNGDLTHTDVEFTHANGDLSNLTHRNDANCDLITKIVIQAKAMVI